MLRIVTVMAAVLMVQEERKRIKPEEVEDASEVPLMKKTTSVAEKHRGGLSRWC